MNRMRRIGAALAALFVSAVMAAPTATDPMATRLLMQMADSMATQSWQGTMMYTQGTQSVSLKVHKDMVAGQPVERIEKLSGDPIQVMRRGSWLLGLYPGNESLRQGHALPAVKSFKDGDRLTHIRNHYRIELGALTRVAGREAQAVYLNAMDDLRFSHAFWCDTETGLILRRQTLDSQREVLEQFEFVSLELIDPVKDDTLVIDAQGMQVFRHRLTENELTDPAPIRRLPAGFMPVGQSQDQMVVTHLFSDGIALVSAFYERVGQPKPDVLAQQGPTRALSRVVEFRDQFFRVTLVGEVPEASLRNLMSEIDWVQMDGLLDG